ncbi:MAG TPA: hypothetical protein DD979_14310 [Gammaproteobacteria bacterium]|jgi:flagellar basal body P-ring protein FlgI|nr:hypothetical protein [Gammaproteobacteria bacterium]
MLQGIISALAQGRVTPQGVLVAGPGRKTTESNIGSAMYVSCLIIQTPDRGCSLKSSSASGWRIHENLQEK